MKSLKFSFFQALTPFSKIISYFQSQILAKMSLASRSQRWIHFFPGKSQAQLATPHPEHVQNEPELSLQPIQKLSYFPVKTNKNNVQTHKRALLFGGSARQLPVFDLV